MDDVRIGDAERDEALRMLGEHLAAGRLDLEEHSERSSRLISARTRGEIRAVFTDLPDPHPSLDSPPKGPVAKQAEPSQPPAAPQGRGAALRKFAGGLTALLWLVAIVVMVSTDIGWWAILVPIGYSMVIGAWAQASGDQRRQLHRHGRRHHGDLRRAHGLRQEIRDQEMRRRGIGPGDSQPE